MDGLETARRLIATEQEPQTGCLDLGNLVDKLQPRDFERQAATGFQEVLRQISPPH